MAPRGRLRQATALSSRLDTMPGRSATKQQSCSTSRVPQRDRPLRCLAARHPDGHLGPLARRAADQNDTTDGGGSLTHGAQAQMTWEGFLRIEPAAVVAYAQHELPCTRLERDHDGPCAGVLSDVVERLLPNPI